MSYIGEVFCKQSGGKIIGSSRRLGNTPTKKRHGDTAHSLEEEDDEGEFTIVFGKVESRFTLLGQHKGEYQTKGFPVLTTNVGAVIANTIDCLVEGFDSRYLFSDKSISGLQGKRLRQGMIGSGSNPVTAETLEQDVRPPLAKR
uniref:Uncharacterized protein n=1 Tax=Timema cristinae TaxID=61476 RepID=A0A7R9H4R7_TIMCR|nr:unnamed protein product [Timema cristinae]